MWVIYRCLPPGGTTYRDSLPQTALLQGPAYGLRLPHDVHRVVLLESDCRDLLIPTSWVFPEIICCKDNLQQ